LLQSGFFARPADVVAPDLIGKLLWRSGVGGGRLVEVEAYLAQDDPACHAYRGRTSRNAAMFGPPGTVYVYVSYGVHTLLNLVCEAEGIASAVLVRALEPVEPSVRLRSNREKKGSMLADSAVTGGPGRVGQALGLDLSVNGAMLAGRRTDPGLMVIDDGARLEVEVTPRIGIGAGADLELRYIVGGSRFLSRPPRRGVRYESGRRTDRGL
jgi:DNA-3-methyladenine glycosylase